MFHSLHLIIGFSNKIFLKLSGHHLQWYLHVFDARYWIPIGRFSWNLWCLQMTAYPAVGFKKMMLTAHPGTCPGCSSLLWSSEQTLARGCQVTLDNSCNSSLGPFSPLISELQPTFKCIMLCKQILSHFLLVHIKARSYDSRAARDLVVWVVVNPTYKLQPVATWN